MEISELYDQLLKVVEQSKNFEQEYNRACRVILETRQERDDARRQRDEEIEQVKKLKEDCYWGRAVIDQAKEILNQVPETIGTFGSTLDVRLKKLIQLYKRATDHPGKTVMTIYNDTGRDIEKGEPVLVADKVLVLEAKAAKAELNTERIRCFNLERQFEEACGEAVKARTQRDALKAKLFGVSNNYGGKDYAEKLIEDTLKEIE